MNQKTDQKVPDFIVGVGSHEIVITTEKSTPEPQHLKKYAEALNGKGDK